MMINYLKKYNLVHAAITLAIMLTLGWLAPWIVATFMTGAYYGREVTHALDKATKDGEPYMKMFLSALWPGNWPTAHDRWQTLWVVVVAYGVALVVGLRLA